MKRLWSCGAAGLVLTVLVAACQPRVIHKCPPNHRTCSATASPTDRTASPSAPVHSKRLLGFRAPRMFGLPHTLTQPQSLAISPRGDRVALGGRWGGLQIVRLSDGKVLRNLGVLEELGAPIRVDFTADGRHLISAGHGHTRVKVWSLSTGRLVRQFKASGYPIRDLAAGPDGLILLATQKGAELWDALKGQLRHTVTMPYNIDVVNVAASRKLWLAAGDRSGTVKVFSARNPNRSSLLRTPGKRLTALAMNAAGDLVATGFEHRQVRLAHTGPLRQVKTFDWYAKGRPVRIRIPKGAAKLVVADDHGHIAHVDTTRGRLLHTHRAPSGNRTISDLTLSPSGAVVASISHQGRVTLWQSEDIPKPLRLPPRVAPRRRPTPKPTLRMIHPSHLVLDTPGLAIAGYALGRRGQFLAVAGKPTQVAVYYLNFTPRSGQHPRAKRLYRRLARAPSRKARKAPLWVAITPDRKWLLAQGAGFHQHRWALVSGRAIRSWRPKGSALRGLVPMHNSRTVVSLTGDRVLGWDLNGRRRFTFDTMAETYWLGVAPNNRRLVAIRGWDRIVTYNLPRGTVRWSAHSGPLASYEVLAMVLPPRSRRLLTYHRNGFLRTYDLDTGALQQRLRIPTPTGVQRCVIRPDGRVLACAHPRGIDLTELPSGASLGTVPPPRPFRTGRFQTRALVYSHKGNVLVAQTTQRQLVAFNFDRPGEVKRYTGVEAVARIRLGLPIVPPKVRVKPSRLPQRGPLESKGALRR